MRLKGVGGWSLSVRVMVGLALLLLTGIYFFHPAYPTIAWKSLAGWTWAACSSANGFLHGRLVPLIFPWLLWVAWRRNQEEAVKPSYWGLVWLGLGMLLFWASMRVVQPRWALFGAPFVVIGMTHYLFGGRIARGMAFPAFFLWFAMPVPGLEGWIDGWSRPILANATVLVGGWLGVDLASKGREVLSGDGSVLISML